MISSEIKGALLATGMLLGAFGTASAATIQHAGSFDGPGNHLYQLLGGIGATSLDTPAEVDAAQMLNDQYWAIQASGGSVSTMIFEISAYSGNTKFGVFDATNSALRVQLWDGSATPGPGGQAILSILADGSVRVNFADSGVDFAGNNFGYYIQLPDGSIFYSDESLNPTGADQMVAFQGNDSDVVTIPGFAPGVWGSNEYIIGWEDLLSSLPLGTTDNDYNDLVIMIESVNPVPEPGTLAVLGLGLLGLGLARRRMMKA